VVQTVGAKKGLLTAMTMATIYATLFAAAIGAPKGGFVQSALYIFGAVLQGIASGILWIAQFTFYTNTVTLCARDEQAPRAQITASLGAVFATSLLIFEVLVKLSASFLQGSVLVFHLFDPLMSIQTMFILFACLAFSMVMIMLFLVQEPAKLEVDSSAPPARCTDKAKAAFTLWPSPLIWCLGGSNVTFGFSAGYMNGYVNASFTSNKDNTVLGKDKLGTLLALTSFTAAVFAKVFGRAQNKGPLVLFSSCCFACIPLSILIFTPNKGNDFWGYGLVVLYVFQGVGRAVYEGTNKAVFSDFFPPEQGPGVGGNIMMQNSFSFFMSFLLQSIFTDKSFLAWIVLALAALTFPGFLLATAIHRQAEQARTLSAT
jgi:MFS family permease